MYNNIKYLKLTEVKCIILSILVFSLMPEKLDETIQDISIIFWLYFDTLVIMCLQRLSDIEMFVSNVFSVALFNLKPMQL